MIMEINTNKHHCGFTLIELLFIIAMVSAMITSGALLLRQHTQNLKVMKTALQMQQIIQAASAFSWDENRWPEWPMPEGKCGEAQGFSDYLPIGSAINPWGNDFFCTQSSAGELLVKTTVPDNNLAKLIAARLPNATVDYKTVATKVADPNARQLGANMLLRNVVSTCYYSDDRGSDLNPAPLPDDAGTSDIEDGIDKTPPLNACRKLTQDLGAANLSGVALPKFSCPPGYVGVATGSTIWERYVQGRDFSAGARKVIGINTGFAVNTGQTSAYKKCTSAKSPGGYDYSCQMNLFFSTCRTGLPTLNCTSSLGHNGWATGIAATFLLFCVPQS